MASTNRSLAHYLRRYQKPKKAQKEEEKSIDESIDELGKMQVELVVEELIVRDKLEDVVSDQIQVEANVPLIMTGSDENIIMSLGHEDLPPLEPFAPPATVNMQEETALDKEDVKSDKNTQAIPATRKPRAPRRKKPSATNV